MRRTWLIPFVPSCWIVLVLSLLMAGPSVAEGPLVLEENSPAFGADGVLVEHIGFETGRGGLTPVLRVGRQCPCERTVSYSTALDDQTEIPIRVLRGKKTDVSSATHLGALMVEGIPQLTAGAAHVRVTLRAEDGRIEIEAVRVETGSPLVVRRIDVPTPAAASR